MQPKILLPLVSPLDIGINVRYTLPRVTIVPHELFTPLICSEVIINTPKFGWTPEFVQAIRQIGNQDEPADLLNPNNQGKQTTPTRSNFKVINEIIL